MSEAVSLWREYKSNDDGNVKRDEEAKKGRNKFRWGDLVLWTLSEFE